MPVNIGSMGEKINPSDPLDEVTFYCLSCRAKFSCEPENIEDDPNTPDHPFKYSCTCIKCGKQAHQAYWEKAMMCSFGKHTGPITEEGRQRDMSHLEGRIRTKEETNRTRFNGLKTGLHAKVLDYFPARPGQYPMCDNCQIRDTICAENTVCAKQAENHMNFRLAFEHNDPKMLMPTYAALQANIQAIIDNMVLSIIKTGVEIREPVWYLDKDGAFNLAYYTTDSGDRRQITEIKAHPLLKILGEYLSRNNISMGDLNMTPKVQEQQDIIKGHLEHTGNNDNSLLHYQERQTTAIENLKHLIAASQQRTNSDPILIEHGQANG